MGLFRKKNKYLKQLKKQKNRTECKYYIFSVLIIVVLMTIMMANSCSLNNFNTFNFHNNFIEINEEDLNLIWSVKNLNQENLKTKLSYSNLISLAQDINPISIADSEKNTPTKNMQLNFDEVGFLANEVISFNTDFTLLEITWFFDNDNVVKVNMMYTYLLPLQENKKLKAYFKHCVDYNIENQTLVDTYFSLLNAPSLTFKDLSKYSELSNEILSFIFKSTKTSTKSPLCRMLGFTSVEILNYGLYYTV